jgi:hypothetical protein
MENNDKSDRTGDSQSPVEEELIWKRASLDSPFIKNIEEVTGMLGHLVGAYTKSLSKQLKHLKKF